MNEFEETARFIVDASESLLDTAAQFAPGDEDAS